MTKNKTEANIPDDTDTIIITVEESGERLDKILARRYEEIRSRTYFQMLIEEQHVLLNGLPVKKRYLPSPGDEVQIDFIITPEIGLEAEPIPLNIVYEDEHILAINKPAGMVVHPATGNWTGTFVNALLYHCKQLYEESKERPNDIRPGIIHRLDKDTSGLLLAAKTSLAQQRLIALFASRKVHKEYLAICLGNPGNCEINVPIGRHPVKRQQMAVVETGKPALTICQCLATDGKMSLLRIVLATGRTHQIRVHLKHLGTPVLGDSVYGNIQANEKYKVNRQLLHAHLLRFDHPITGKELILEAKVPADFAVWMKKLSVK